MNRENAAQQQPINPGSFLCLGVAMCTIYYLLLVSNIKFISISQLLFLADELSRNWHLVVIAAIPIYAVLIIFSSTLLSLRLGNALNHLMSDSSVRKSLH